MRALKFTGRDKTQFVAALRRKVNDYFKDQRISRRGDRRIVWKTVVMLSMYIIPFTVLLSISLNAWIVLLLYILMGVGMAGIGMAVMHDAAHNSLFKKNWINKLFAQTIYLMGGSVFTWKIQHNLRHHTYTNIAGHDEDIQGKAVLRFSQYAPLKKVHRFQHVYGVFLYSLMTISKLWNDFLQLREYNRSGLTRDQNASPARENIKMFLFKAGYLFLVIGLPLLFSSFSWWIVLIGFLLMHMTASLIMSIVFQLAHIVEGVEQPMPDNSGNIESDWIIHELKTTSNFARNNRLLSWYTGGLNFQIEHHLFPGICHIHYKKLSFIVEETAKEYGINYNLKKSLRSALLSHLRMMQMLGRSERMA